MPVTVRRLRGPAERPQRILQPFGQGDEAFAIQHDMGVLKPEWASRKWWRR
jgi:hypothetical protein